MNDQLNIEGKVYKEIKTADINRYMREYSRNNYNKNKSHIRRMKNTRNLLKSFDVNLEVKNKFNEYTYDLKILLDIVDEMPPDLLRYALDELANDKDTIFTKKNNIETSDEKDNEN
jgi:triphosphoribosyl-dephospho-CoA synthetase